MRRSLSGEIAGLLFMAVLVIAALQYARAVLRLW